MVRKGLKMVRESSKNGPIMVQNSLIWSDFCKANGNCSLKVRKRTPLFGCFFSILSTFLMLVVKFCEQVKKQ